MNLSPLPIQKFYDNNGVPLVGGQLFTYITGTNTKLATYTDSTGGTPNPNPIPLNYRGEAQVWIDPLLVYKFVLAPANDTDPPTNPFWSVDQLATGLTYANLITILTQSFIGQILYPRTAAEIAANASVINYNYPPLTVDRYGTNTTPVTTIMTTAFQAAINVAKRQGGVVTWGVGPYLIDAALDLTNPVGSQNCMFALIGQGRFKAPTNSVGTTATPSLFIRHPGHAFDTTGSQGIHFENMSIATDNTTYPQTLFLLARNSDGNSRTDRILNCYALGKCSRTMLYNYGAEDGTYEGNQLYNIATDANTSVFDISGFNIRNITSTFTTIATGSRSCLDHKIISGEYGNFGAQATSDVFRFDGARSVKIIGPWLDSSNQLGTVSGRSLIYVDGTNAPSALVTLIGIDGEANGNPATYGILFSNNAQTHSNWTVLSNTFPNVTAMLGGGAGATLTQMTWSNNSNQSTGGGVNFAGTISGSYSDNTSGGFTAGTLTNDNNTDVLSKVLSRNGEIDITMFDTSQAVGSKGWRIRSVGTWALSTVDDAGNVTANIINATRTGAMNFINKLYPGSDAGVSQSIAGLYGGTGVPSNANGNNGDFYFRGDTPGTAGQRLYIKSAGAWVATAL